MAVDLKPGEVPVVGADGKFYAVPEASVSEALRQGGKVATPEQLQEHEYGESGGKLTAGALGAAETLTLGGSTAAMAEGGVLLDGQRGRRAVEDQIRQYERTNPISHVVGEALPLFLQPEMVSEAGPLIAGEGLGARAVNFAVPRLVEGATQEAVVQGSQGTSEDLLNHNFTAQSFLSHAATPEVLIGGVANVGVGALLHGAGSGMRKLLSSESKAALTTEARLTIDDALAAEHVTAAAQKSGRTSDEAASMFGDMQTFAQQAAADPARASFVEKVAKAHARMVSGGSADVERALNRAYAEAADRFQGAERILDRTAKEATEHSDALFRGVSKMNDLQFGLKPQTVQKLVDPARFTSQVDAALGLRAEIGKMIDAASSSVDVRTPDVKRVWDTVQKLDGAIADAVDVNAAALGTKAADSASREAAAKLYLALDDTKRVIGRAARFGQEGKDGGAQLAEAIYEQRLRPVLEDQALWGSDLGKMQAQTNAAFADGFAATQRYQQMLGQVLETPGGRKLYSTDRMRMRGVLSELEHAVSDGDITGLRAEVVQRVVDSTRARAQSMVDTMALKPAEVAELKKTVEAANRLESTMKRAQSEAADARTLKELKSRESSSGGLNIIKTLTGAVTSPVHAQQVLAGLQSVEAKVRKVISSDAKAFVSGERIMPTARAATAASRESVERAMVDLQTAASTPAILKERVARLVKGIVDVDPNASAAVAVTAARIVNYLASEIPPPLAPRFLETKPRWAPQDVDDFARKLDMAMRPLTVFEKMQSGRLHHDEQKVLTTVYDELYQEMQTSLMKEYRTAKEKGYLKKLTAQEREMMSFMMEAPLEAHQQPAFVARMQEAAMSDPNAQGAVGAQAAGKGRPRRTNLKFEDLRTESEKIGS